MLMLELGCNSYISVGAWRTCCVYTIYIMNELLISANVCEWYVNVVCVEVGRVSLSFQEQSQRFN